MKTLEWYSGEFNLPQHLIALIISDLDYCYYDEINGGYTITPTEYANKFNINLIKPNVIKFIEQYILDNEDYDEVY